MEDVMDQDIIGRVLRVKRFHPDAVIPEYATEGSVGFDFHAVKDVVVRPGVTLLIPTGLAVEVPEGCELQVRPRSGMSLKTGALIKNSPGTIDSDYRGEIRVIMANIGHEYLRIKKGDRIAQGVLAPVIQAVEIIDVEELNETDRGEGGFGSTGD